MLVIEEKECSKIKEFCTGGHMIITDSIDPDTAAEIRLLLSAAPQYELGRTVVAMLSLYSWAILETYPILVTKPPKMFISDVFTQDGFI